MAIPRVSLQQVLGTVTFEQFASAVPGGREALRTASEIFERNQPSERSLVDQPLDKALNYLWLHFHCEDIKRERRKSVKAKRRKATVEVPFDRAAAILLLGQWMDILLQPRREAFMEAIMAFDVDDR